jgi:hypothetical protein
MNASLEQRGTQSLHPHATQLNVEGSQYQRGLVTLNHMQLYDTVSTYVV